MSKWQVHIEGIGLYAPGMNGWPQAREVLTGRMDHVHGDLSLPVAEALPPAERRRMGLTLKLAMACGFEAVQHANADASRLAAVFSSTAGDCDNCHHILESLASEQRAVSPTRFHNSVHNMPAGYWSIAAGCMAPSTSLCAYDATFSAGLIEAATQVTCSRQPCLLIAFDTTYPEPLRSLRPIPHPFGLALVLGTQKTPHTLATIAMTFSNEPANPMAQPALETMRTKVPSARGLPLMKALADRTAAGVVLDYLDDLRLAVEVLPA